MKNALFRLTSSSLFAATSIFAFGLAEPSLPKFSQSHWLTQGQLLAAEMPASEIYEQTISSVVTLYPVDQDFNTLDTFGSGFVVRSDGLIVTNAHVINSETAAVAVVFADGSQGIAMVVGYDSQGRDLAALQLIGEFQLSALTLATGEMPRIGEAVYAIGAPRGFSNTMTSGIVGNVAPDQTQILHNATINGGNSGGPLLNDQGQVIGMNTWIYNATVETADGEVIGQANGYSGMSFAISANEIMAFVTDLTSGQVSSVSQPAAQVAHNY
ncbi:S1C family serine protease [Leptothoe spongobia]|uniref:Trypsin-like peptidase domain-containing protein n=1 Tax=Leptothoe spongobia TAU-MAC 1115 TaxID=1967444 RepID=A0A947DKZ6_9CYAN|nr:trypsin-like peptidase domain-containing protein [Leptothoe spongobia]MBT9317586.1 trypsin-like peptidase domain-containing protein [Leptothoe spongobia TAU-MAC 1115]